MITPNRGSKRIAGEKLSNDVAELEQHRRTRYYILRRRRQEARYAYVTCAFRLLDLILELRLRIYSFAMSTDSPR